MMNDQKLELIEGSGNVFRDLGEPDAALKQAKAVLAARIIKMLDDSGHTVREAALLSGFAAADFSRIRNADLGRFTLDRLIRMLAALDIRKEIRIHISQEGRDHVTTHGRGLVQRPSG